MDILFLDTNFVNEISKILMDSLIEPIKKAIAESITETVKETIQYELKDTLINYVNCNKSMMI